MPTPSVADSLGGHESRGGDRSDELLLGGVAKAYADDALVPLLPTPNPFHAGNTETPEEWRHRRADVFERTGTRHGPALSVVAWSIEEGNPLTPDRYMPDQDDEEDAQSVPDDGALLPTPVTDPDSANGHARNLGAEARLLPTPTSQDSASSGNGTGVTLTDATARGRTRWGDYQPAIDRWTRLIGRAPGSPTQTGSKGNPQLAPTFVEWMMGLLPGWVTDPAIWHGWKPVTARNAMLKALGNGVVPQQAYAALSELTTWGPLWQEDDAA